jgi:hypothetical protein
MNGVERIAAERQRQVEVEKWDDAHDSNHVHGELSIAASCYALCEEGEKRLPENWPWDRAYWKPSNRLRMLEKAGALIAAEIDRILSLDQS